MSRVIAIFIGIVLGALAGVVLAISNLIDADKLLGPGMSRFEPYVKVTGVALGAVILVVALLVIGVGVGRWRRPVTAHHRRRSEVRW